MTQQMEFVDWYDPDNLLEVSDDDVRFMNERARASTYFIYYRCFDTIEKKYGLPHVKLERPKDSFYNSSFSPAMVTKTENTHYMLAHTHNRFETQHEIIEDFFGTMCRGMTFGIGFTILQAWIENRFEIHELELIRNGNNPIHYINNVYQFELNLNANQVQNKFYKNS